MVQSSEHAISTGWIDVNIAVPAALLAAIRQRVDFSTLPRWCCRSTHNLPTT